MAKPKSRSKSKEKHDKEDPPVARAMRSFWSGTISFGLVSVPVSLFPAVRGKITGLRMLDTDGTPLSRQFYCPQHQHRVHPEHILRGYEVSDGKYVVVRDEELEALAPEKSRDIDLKRFVPQEQLSPSLFDRAYFLVPDGDSNKAYRLLAHAMQESNRAGIATFVMRGKEHLVAILSERLILRAETLRFPDEVRTPEDLQLPEPVEPAKESVERFEKAINRHFAEDIDRDAMHNEYAAKLRELVERKFSKRRDVVEVDGNEEGHEDGRSEVDLLDVIRRSMARETTYQDGSPSGKGSLQEQTKDELYETAAQLDISGRSKMNKQQLVRAIRRSRS